MFKVSPASLQIFIDTPNCVIEDRVQYSTVHIPNVLCDSSNHQLCGDCSNTLSFCAVIIRCKRLFDHSVYSCRNYLFNKNQFYFLFVFQYSANEPG
jgi:predicted amidophosphoribosyltransferase